MEYKKYSSYLILKKKTSFARRDVDSSCSIEFWLNLLLIPYIVIIGAAFMLCSRVYARSCSHRVITLGISSLTSIVSLL